MSFVTECAVETKVLGTCLMTIPRSGNSELHEVKLENQESEKDLLLEVGLSGLTVKPNSACLGVKETTEGRLKSIIKAEGVIHL